MPIDSTVIPDATSDIRLPQDAGPVQPPLWGLGDHWASYGAELQHLQRLASLGTLSAMLAHELNNLLTPMLNYAKYAVESGDPAMQRTALEKTLAGAERMRGMVERILGTAVGGAETEEASSVLAAATESVEALGRDPQKDRIQVSVDVADDIYVSLDGGKLRQVLLNLVMNARQAMLDRGGRLAIAARVVDSQMAEITVSDTGVGMRSDQMAKAFDPFFSTKRGAPRRDRGGVGLGLTICRWIVEAAGGTIGVTSQPGRGTTFTVRLQRSCQLSAFSFQPEEKGGR